MSRHLLPSWSAVNMTLPWGYRGLPGDSTLDRLLGEFRRREPGLAKPPLNTEYILPWLRSHRQRTRPIRGFITPPTGSFNAQFEFISYAGDLGQTGDSLSLNSATLSDATRLANNFFLSSITNLAKQVTAKNSKCVNQIGFAIGMVSADSIRTNGSPCTTLTAVGENCSVGTANADPPSVSCIICRAPPEGLKSCYSTFVPGCGAYDSGWRVSAAARPPRSSGTKTDGVATSCGSPLSVWSSGWHLPTD